MKRRQDLFLKSFGAREFTTPSSSSIAKWAGSQKAGGDLLSYVIEAQVKEQIAVISDSMSLTPSLSFSSRNSTATFGGEFYKKRILDSLHELKSNFLVGEVWIDTSDLIADSKRIAKMKFSKSINSSVPAPSSLNIEDGYYNDRTEFISALCEIYSKFMRDQRDNGTCGHIITAESFDSTELEELSKERVTFFTPTANSKVFESILEYQNTIAVSADKLPLIFEMMNEYEIVNVCVIDGKRESYESCLNYFDPDRIFAGGYEKSALGESNYWKNLKENAYLMR